MGKEIWSLGNCHLSYFALLLIEGNSTGIHWHGMHQLNSNNQDGANGVTECPIAPGSSRSYTFRAVNYGSSWFHR